MDVSVISSNAVKIKGKQAMFLVDALDTKKNTADGILLLDIMHTPEFFKDNGVIFQGAGEYEVKGAKITGFKAEEDVMYTLMLDGMSVFVGSVVAATKAKDKVHEHDVVVLLANDVLTQASLGFLNPHVVLFFGEKLEESAKAFGKELQKISKYTITKDKLPQETEFVFLG